jgi:hypothetical protein
MPNPFSPLQGYDLPTAAQRILEEVDGVPPAPAFFADEQAVPGTLTIQPDNRGPAAVVVGLTLIQGSNPPSTMDYRADVQVKGVTLVEGELPADALGHDAERFPPILQSPIRLDAKTPLKVNVSMLTGIAPATSAMRAELQVLYGSVAACDEVMKRLGQARWWSFFAPPDPGGGDFATGTLTVEIGGRPSYVRSIARFNTPDVTITLDGLTLTPDPVTQDLRGQSFLPHSVEQARVYAYRLATGGAGTGRSFWVWHGPSDDY